jgi:2-iminobutanoate/2-iminopropanoate deaminase
MDAGREVTNPTGGNRMQAVLTDQAPKPAGHYSQAVVANGFVFVAGQLPIDPAKGPRTQHEPVPDIEAQVTRTLANVEAILIASGSSIAGVVRCTVYVTDVGLWPRVNAAYAAFFAARTSVPPARTVVPCPGLHYGYQVEIDAIGVQGIGLSEEQ